MNECWLLRRRKRVQSLVDDAVQGRLPAEPDVLNIQNSVPQAAQNRESCRCGFSIALAKVASQPWKPIKDSAAMEVCAKR